VGILRVHLCGKDDVLLGGGGGGGVKVIEIAAAYLNFLYFLVLFRQYRYWEFLVS
jgi:hypothetical protein